MAASTGKKGSKIDFSKSIRETINASNPIKNTESIIENTSAINDVESKFSDLKKEINGYAEDSYGNNKNNVNNINNNNNPFLSQMLKPTGKEKIDMDKLVNEAIQRKKEKGVKHTTFSVSYKIGGEFEKLLLVASEKYGFNRSLYLRKLMLDDYIQHKEEYDEILTHL